MTKLNRDFYLRDTITVARELLGCRLVHAADGKRSEVIITETEAYCGIHDKACHSYGGRYTERTKVMYKEGGCAYVYFIYGMYSCFNVVAEEEGIPCAVLIRGGKPVGDLDVLAQRRYSLPYSELTPYKLKHIADGPGKLCIALGIDRSLNGEDLTGNTLFIEQGEKPEDIKIGKRINIDYAKEARDFNWRFYI